MAKPGRNDRCPCGSGKKYKACWTERLRRSRARGWQGWSIAVVSWCRHVPVTSMRTTSMTSLR